VRLSSTTAKAIWTFKEPRKQAKEKTPIKRSRNAIGDLLVNV
jgi:hypothetical protein